MPLCNNCGHLASQHNGAGTGSCRHGTVIDNNLCLCTQFQPSSFSDHIPNFVNDDDIVVCSICDAKPYNHKPVDPHRTLRELAARRNQ